jgi:hypothetical protein
VFFFNFLGGFSATELLALFEPCQVKVEKAVIGGFDSKMKNKDPKISVRKLGYLFCFLDWQRSRLL